MQQTITNKLAVLVAAVALAFGAAYTAFAYEALEIEIDVLADTTEVEVQYEEDGEDVTDEYEYNTTDLDEVYTLLAVALGLTAEEVEDAVVDIDTEEEMEDADEAAEAIADAEEAIADLEAYIATLDEDDDADEIEDLEADLAAAQSLLEDAEEALAAEDYDAAEGYADDAEDIVDAVLGDDDENEEEGDDDDDRSDFCDRTSQAAGWGVAKKCVEDDDYVINDKMAAKVIRFQDRSMEKYQDYGVSQDREVLQNQLRELMLLLIQLLQQQMAAQES